MYMRFLHVNVRQEAMPDIRKLYEEHIVPTLHKVPGCLYASLIQSVHHQDECISMTLWKTAQHAADYERSGVFATLLQSAQPYLVDSSEWNIHLSDDLTLQYDQVKQEPVVDEYVVSSQGNEGFLSQEDAEGFYVRIVSPQIQHGKAEEFKRIYTDAVLPRLHAVHGCQYAAIIASAQEPDKVISITIWNTKRDADAYENSGVFHELTDKMRHMFSEVYQWKMQLERETGRQVVTSADVSVEGFSIVTGKSFL